MDLNLYSTIYYLSDCMSMIIAAICGVLCYFRVRRRIEYKLFFTLLGGFYACVFLCHFYFLLTWYVIDYPYIISPGDFSWVGGIVFLITADMALIDTQMPEQKEKLKMFRLIAMAAPAICTAFNVAFVIIYPEIIINYMLYYIPTAILSYYALYLFVAGSRGRKTPLRNYHLITLIWIAFQLFHDFYSTLGWDYGYALPTTIFIWLVVIATPFVYVSAIRGINA